MSNYDTDFYAWTQQQAEGLRAQGVKPLDWEPLAEEIESLGRRDRRAIGHYLERLLKHLLKWTYQPEQRPRYGRSWARSIRHSRRQIAELIADSPSLHTYPAQHLATAYRPALEDAADETDLPLTTFPAACPWTVEAVLDPTDGPDAPTPAGGLRRRGPPPQAPPRQIGRGPSTKGPMTPTDEATFIALWQQGASYRELAAALGCPLGTVASRAHTLAHQGKLTPRPRGGASPRQQALARQAATPQPVQRPVQPIDTGAVQSFDTGPVQRLDRLEDEVQGLRLLMQSVVDRLDHPPVQTPVQITALPPYPKGKAVRWNLWILDAIRDDLAALAAERDVSRVNWCRSYCGKR